MRPGLICVLLLLGVISAQASRHHHHEDEPAPSPFAVGGLLFPLPDSWLPMPRGGAARAGQWRIPLAHGIEGEGAQAVAYYFGPHAGGTVKENFDGWSASLLGSSGQASKVAPAVRKVTGFTVSQAALFGTYNQSVPAPGVPPVTKPNWGMIGVVVEGPQGNVFWCVTGPAALITALEPVVTAMVDGLKTPPAPVVAKP